MVHHFIGNGRILNYIDGQWIDGNPGIIGPMTHGLWLGSTVFDGARAFENVTPDLDRHCHRVVNSAAVLGLKELLTTEAIVELALEGFAQFPKGAEIYIKPMLWAEDGFVDPDPETTKFCLTLFEAPMPPFAGSSITLSPFRRPTAETAPTQAKAACLYPNGGRAIFEARKRGYNNALMLDALGNVAELATANIFMVKDGIVLTPAANGTFLNGITRQRIIALLQTDGVEVLEKTLSYQDFLEAEEIFSTGNFAKVSPINKFEDKELNSHKLATRARELYWDWAHSKG